MVSINFEKVPKIIPINNIYTVFIICLKRGIGFSALLISFKNFFILYPCNFRLLNCPTPLFYHKCTCNSTKYCLTLVIKAASASQGTEKEAEGELPFG
jgi:hypothetical protein